VLAQAVVEPPENACALEHKVNLAPGPPMLERPPGRNRHHAIDDHVGRVHPSSLSHGLDELGGQQLKLIGRHRQLDHRIEGLGVGAGVPDVTLTLHHRCGARI